jgi:uncharacterized protein (DUF1330 family)
MADADDMTTEAATTRAYGIGLLHNVTLGPPIVDYLERIDATLAPFGGRFIVHGGAPELLEGAHPGDVVIIEFPDRARASAWYHSPAYRAILPLRTENSDSTVVIVDGVGPDHVATDVLRRSASTS